MGTKGREGVEGEVVVLTIWQSDDNGGGLLFL